MLQNPLGEHGGLGRGQRQRLSGIFQIGQQFRNAGVYFIFIKAGIGEVFPISGDGLPGLFLAESIKPLKGFLQRRPDKRRQRLAIGRIDLKARKACCTALVIPSMGSVRVPSKSHKSSCLLVILRFILSKRTLYDAQYTTSSRVCQPGCEKGAAMIQ